MTSAPIRIRRAIVATRLDEVRDFLAVHLEERGFAIEHVHRAEYLQIAAPGADLLLCDEAMWRAAALPPGRRPHEVMLLASEPTLAQAMAARADGVREVLTVPFADARQLALALDEAAERARLRCDADIPALIA